MYSKIYTPLHFEQDVDQRTGEDLNPAVNQMLRRGEEREETRVRNPDRPSNLTSVVRDEDSHPVRGMTRMTSPEKWEIKQLIAAGVLEKSDYPGTYVSMLMYENSQIFNAII